MHGRIGARQAMLLTRNGLDLTDNYPANLDIWRDCGNATAVFRQRPRLNTGNGKIEDLSQGSSPSHSLNCSTRRNLANRVAHAAAE